MLKLAVVDDENAVCMEIEDNIIAVCSQLNIKCDTDVYYKGETICAALDQNNHYDIIFLDIELAQMNGVDTGLYIREKLSNNATQIIFISSKQDYAMQLFEIRPLNFLIKPITKKQIYDSIIKYQSLFTFPEYFQYHFKRIGYKIAFSDILFFESDDKIINIYTKTGVSEFYGKLSSVIDTLPSSYCQIHKSFIINTAYISQYKYDEIIMVNHSVLPISKKFRKDVRSKLLSLHSGDGEDFFQ